MKVSMKMTVTKEEYNAIRKVARGTLNTMLNDVAAVTPDIKEKLLGDQEKSFASFGEMKIKKGTKWGSLLFLVGMKETIDLELEYECDIETLNKQGELLNKAALLITPLLNAAIELRNRRDIFGEIIGGIKETFGKGGVSPVVEEVEVTDTVITQTEKTSQEKPTQEKTKEESDDVMKSLGDFFLSKL